MKLTQRITTLIITTIGVLVLTLLGIGFLIQAVHLDQNSQSVEAGKILLLTLGSWGGVIVLARASFSNIVSLLKKK